jgi:hypothetical protein
LNVHARIDEEWSRTRTSFIKAVTCGRDLCVQVAMQTDPYINTARCVGIAAAPTRFCVVPQRPTNLAMPSISRLLREAHVPAWEVGYLEAFLSCRWDTTTSSQIHITSAFLIIMSFCLSMACCMSFGHERSIFCTKIGRSERFIPIYDVFRYWDKPSASQYTVLRARL